MAISCVKKLNKPIKTLSKSGVFSQNNGKNWKKSGLFGHFLAKSAFWVKIGELQSKV
jgi:hypothetical protein